MARYANHWSYGRPTYKVRLGRSHFEKYAIDYWGEIGAPACANIARQTVRKWLKDHQHLGEYNDRRIPCSPEESVHPYEVIFTFTNPQTAFHFKMRWG